MREKQIAWRETKRRLEQDRRRIRVMVAARFGRAPRLLIFQPAYLCALLYRNSHYWWCRGSGKLGRLLAQLNMLLTGADIHPNSEIGGGLLIPSPCGVNLSGVAGENLTALHVSGFGIIQGDRDVGAGPGLPVLGDNVVLSAFTGVLGPVRIGHGVQVCEGAVVIRDVPDGAAVVVAAQGVSGPQRPRRRVPVSGEHACRHKSFAATWRDFQLDVDRYLEELASSRPTRSGRLRRLGAVLTNQLLATFLYRLSHHLHANGRRWAAMAACRINVLLNRASISPGSCIGGGLFMPHPAGVVLNCRAGVRLTLYADAICTSHGDGLASQPDGVPTLGDRVTIGGHAGVLGPVRVGSDAQIAYNVHLCDDSPSGCIVVGPAMRVRVQAGLGMCKTVDSAAPGPAVPGPGVTWCQTRRRLSADRARLEEISRRRGDGAPVGGGLFPGYVCVWLYRLSHYFYGRRRMGLAMLFWQANMFLTGADVSPSAEIAGGLVIPQPAGVAIDGVAGRNLTVMALAGIGPSPIQRGGGVVVGAGPVLGDDVYLAHHSGVHGPVRIGNGVRVPPGCILTMHVDDSMTLAGLGVRLLRTRSAAEGGRKP